MRHRRHLCRPIIATGEQTSRTRFSQAGSTHPRCKHSFVLSFTANCKPKEPCPWWNARNLSLLISSTFFSTARISASFVFSSRQYTQPSPFPCPQANDWRMLISFFSTLLLFLRFESLIPVLYGLLMFLFKGGWHGQSGSVK